jgi:hypothetical protein
MSVTTSATMSSPVTTQHDDSSHQFASPVLDTSNATGASSPNSTNSSSSPHSPTNTTMNNNYSTNNTIINNYNNNNNNNMSTTSSSSNKNSPSSSSNSPSTQTTANTTPSLSYLDESNLKMAVVDYPDIMRLVKLQSMIDYHEWLAFNSKFYNSLFYFWT